MRRWRLGVLLLVFASASLHAQTIAFISDFNGRYGSTSYDERVGDALRVVTGLQPDLVVSTGDMVAGQKQPRLDGDRLDRMWDAFDRVVTDPLETAGIPFLVTPGNHDGSAFPGFELERERFQARWLPRRPELEFLPGSEWPWRYAARMSGVLMVAFDGTLPGPLPEQERAFLENVLGRFSHEATLTIVYSHLPMWPLAKGRESEIIDDPAVLDLLHRSGVDVYASGHHHVFYAGTDSAGMIHLGMGALGGDARKFSGERLRQPFSFALLQVEHGQVVIESRAAPDFSGSVPETGLPHSVTGPLGALRRIDNPVDLRP